MKKIAVMNSKGLIFGLIVLAFLFSFSNCKKENQLPSCTITYPNNGDEFEQGDTIAISVEANDNDGLIAEVNFYINDIGIFSSSSFPYGYRWNTIDETIGNHIIKVIAKDNEGGSKTNESNLTDSTKPSAEYLRTIIIGIQQTHKLTNQEIANYLIDKRGVNGNYTADELQNLFGD